MKSKHAYYIDKWAGFGDWVENRKQDWANLQYLSKHKYHVLRAGLKLDLPFLQLALHDYNKFYPSVWIPWREWSYSKKVETPLDAKLFQDWRKAVQKHYESESHAHHYHKMGVPVEKVPIEYRIERLADHYGVYRANFKGPGKPMTLTQFWMNRRERSPIDPIAKSLIDQKLIYNV